MSKYENGKRKTGKLRRVKKFDLNLHQKQEDWFVEVNYSNFSQTTPFPVWRSGYHRKKQLAKIVTEMFLVNDFVSFEDLLFYLFDSQKLEGISDFNTFGLLFRYGRYKNLKEREQAKVSSSGRV